MLSALRDLPIAMNCQNNGSKELERTCSRVTSSSKVRPSVMNITYTGSGSLSGLLRGT